MDENEENVARQARGPFTSVQERQRIRASAEHWWDKQRYSAEQRRRFQRYGWWFGIAVPVVLGAIKILEALLGKGG